MCLLTLLAFVVEEQAVMRQGQGELHFRCFHFSFIDSRKCNFYVLDFLSEPLIALIVIFKLNI